MLDDNPLRQYFRRPVLYVKLPSNGTGYPAGALDLPDNGEIPIYSMTAIDEITCRTPDALYNGTSVVEVIRSCAPNIKDPWMVTNVDLDPLLVAIKIASGGDKMEIGAECQKCKEPLAYDVNLPNVLAGFKAGDYQTPINVDGMEIKFKPLSFIEINKANESQFKLQKMIMSAQETSEGLSEEEDKSRNAKNSGILVAFSELAMQLLSTTIEYIKTSEVLVTDPNYILDFFKNCDKRVYEIVKDHNQKLRQSTETPPLKLKCNECQHEFEQAFTINMSDFFD